MGHHVLGENAQRVLIKFVAEIDIPLAKDGLEFSRAELNVMFFIGHRLQLNEFYTAIENSFPITCSNHCALNSQQR